MVKPVSFRLAAFAAVLLGSACGAMAQNVTLNLTPSTLSGSAGTEIFFSGTITNNDTTTDNLDALNVTTFSSSIYQPSGDMTFFNDVPAYLSPSQSYSGPLFGIDISTGATSGTYQGEVQLTFDTGGASTYMTPEQYFSVLVTGASAMPDSSTMQLALVGIPFLAPALVRRRRRAGADQK